MVKHSIFSLLGVVLVNIRLKTSFFIYFSNPFWMVGYVFR